MNVCTEYLYSFANASLTIRVIEYLRQTEFPIDSVAVINLVDRWLVKVKMKYPLSVKATKNIRAVFGELGIAHQPSIRLSMALQKLEAGESPTKVMNRYQIVVVAHGEPDKQEIEIFRRQIVERLGYCPQHLA